MRDAACLRRTVHKTAGLPRFWAAIAVHGPLTGHLTIGKPRAGAAAGAQNVSWPRGSNLFRRLSNDRARSCRGATAFRPCVRSALGWDGRPVRHGIMTTQPLFWAAPKRRAGRPSHHYHTPVPPLSHARPTFSHARPTFSHARPSFSHTFFRPCLRAFGLKPHGRKAVAPAPVSYASRGVAHGHRDLIRTAGARRAVPRPCSVRTPGIGACSVRAPGIGAS